MFSEHLQFRAVALSFTLMTYRVNYSHVLLTTDFFLFWFYSMKVYASSIGYTNSSANDDVYPDNWRKNTDNTSYK